MLRNQMMNVQAIQVIVYFIRENLRRHFKGQLSGQGAATGHRRSTSNAMQGDFFAAKHLN